MIKDRLNSLNLVLPKTPKSAGLYVPVVITGNLVFVSGQLPIEQGSNSSYIKFGGKVGKDISLEDGKKAAQLCTMNALSQLEFALGSLDRVDKFIKISGYVNCEASFTEHPKIIDGASDLILQIFGEKGKHTRVALGMNSLPLNGAVEIDYIVAKE
ncbi:MAG TPA: RidA family protein [Nitrososphaeraceae archaeon]|jgi:enamine deaminase RidA (YjgF/YER057c/UK114 family)